MKVRVPNAMTVNTVGNPNGPSVPFPLAQEVERHPAGVVGTYLYPVALREVMDLLIPHMLPFTMLTGVDTYEFAETGTAPLAQTCTRFGVEVLAEDSDTVIIPTADLLTLFGELQTYNLTGLDLASAHDDLPARWCAVWEGPWPALTRLPESRLFMSSHDDAGVRVETRDNQLSLELGQRLLAMLAGTHLLSGPGSIEVLEPPLDLVAMVLGDERAFSCSQDTIQRTRTIVEVPFVRQYRKPYETIPPTHTLAYDGSVGTWTVSDIR